ADLLKFQLDYIYFFYGASFVFLGAVCFSILKRSPGSGSISWFWLGSFGFLHGIHEWIEIIAIALGDALWFKALRLTLLLFSFICLIEFARGSTLLARDRRVGLWFYIFPALLSSLGFWFGLEGFSICVRYCFGFTGAFWASLVLLGHARASYKPLSASSRIFLRCAGGAMLLYAFATGLIVAPAHFFPANIVNSDTFMHLTHFPVQLLRGALSFVIATAVVLFAVNQSMQSFIKEDNRELKRFIISFTLYFVFILLFFYIGWRVVDYSGRRVEKEENIARHLKTKVYVQFVYMSVKKLEAISALAGSPDISTVFSKESLSSADMSVVNEHIDRYRAGIGADVCYLMDNSGLTLASSNRDTTKSFVGKNYAFRPYFKEAVKGRMGIYLAKGVTSNERGLYVSYPVFGRGKKAGDLAVGVAVAKGSLDSLGEYFKTYKYIFLVSPDGVIFVSSRPDWVFRSITNLTLGQKEALRISKQFGDGPWDNVGFENMDEASGTVSFENKLFRFVHEDIADLAGWKIVFIDDKSSVAITRLMLISIFLIFFLLVSVVSLFFFKISLDSIQTSASEALHAALVDGSPDSIELYNKEGRCVYINKHGLEMMSWKKEDCLGNIFEEFWPQPYKEIARNAAKDGLAGRARVFEAKMLRSDGSSVIKSVTLVPIFDHNGRVKYFGCIARDVTEDRRTRERLVQSSKMATVGSLATGVSHEFNNVLEIILGNAELAFASGDTETMKNTLKLIIDSARRAAWIIKTMLDFSGKSYDTRDRLDIAEIIKQNLVLLDKVFEANNITLETHFKDVPRVYCNHGQLSQAFVNIMMNARDAMRGLPIKKLTITLDHDVDRSEVIVCFKDTGVGINEELKSKIFGPFVTTKGILGGGDNKQPGAGLGLFVAYGIVKQHNGNITVESEEGKGAKFCITLPTFTKEY
ncbi:MAG: ATP-binding protein, partial [Candidatus Omnitrophota bacterium]